MKRKLRDYDLEKLVARVKAAADPRTRVTDDPLIQSDIPKTSDPKRAIQTVRAHIVAALLDKVRSEDDLRADDPLVHAFIRTTHSPLAAPIPPIETDRDFDISPKLRALAEQRADLVWDPAAVQADLFASIRQHGDHELDDSIAPWLTDWGPASAGKPLLWFATLEKMGDLPPPTPKVDEHEKGTADEERRHYEETKHIKPSPLVAPPPPKKV